MSFASQSGITLNMKVAMFYAAFLSLLAAIFLTPISAVAENLTQKTVEFGAPVKSEGGIPAGWELKKWSGKPVITVEKENGSSPLRLFSDKSSFGIGKEVKLSTTDYPYIQWRWKVTRLPEGADVRVKNANDQAAQLYLVFPKFPTTINSRVIGYIWDSTAPEGACFDSPVSPNIKYIVVRSGKNQLGKWVAETRNVHQDYRTLFGEEPPMLEKLFIMIDSDNTKTVAESYFDGIQFQKRTMAAIP